MWRFGGDPQARLRQLAAGGYQGQALPDSSSAPVQRTDVQSLDQSASIAVQNESVVEALAALFPRVGPAEAANIGIFLQHQGVTNRVTLLMALRAQGGKAVLGRASNPEMGLSLVDMAVLEEMVGHAHPQQVAYEEGPSVSGPPPWAPFADPGTRGATPGPDANLDLPADFGTLRPYLDSAGIGDPTRTGIPTQRTMDAAIKAAMKHTIPFTPEVPSHKFPREWADRPLANWLGDAAAGFWASTIVGAAGTGDCFNRLSHAATIAKDPRYPAHIAERAAVRYDAARSHGVCLDALKARSGEEVRACYREACETYDAGAADRLLAEEASLPRARQEPGATKTARPAATGDALESLKAGIAGGAQVCLLWGMGACSKSEPACGKAHVCPYCGGFDKGCLLRHPNHLATIKRHSGSQLEAGRWRGKNQDRPDRRRSRSRTPHRGGQRQGPKPHPGNRQNRAVKTERSRSGSPR